MPKAHARCHISVGVSWVITKLLFNKSCSCLQFSRLFLIPLISSLCSALIVLLQTQHHPTIIGLPPQSTKPISTFDNPNTKSTKPNQNNSKSTQNNLKSSQTPLGNPSQTQPKTKSTQNQTQNPQKINSKLNHQLKTHKPNPKSK